MRAGIDMDGVIACFESGFAPLLAPYTFNLKDPTFPPVWEWPAHYGVPKSVESAAWDVVTKSTRFWFDLTAMPNGVDDVHALREAKFQGHDIYFITNRPGIRAKEQTEAWLELRGFPTPTVLVSADKSACTAALNIGAYIDDKPSNLEGHDEMVRLFMKSAPYNASSTVPAMRVNTVREMLTKLGV